jgi:hypothetical protein
LSFDQRPGKLRLVQDNAEPRRRKGDGVTIDGTAEHVGGAPAAPAARRFPLLGVLLFLLGCAGGGAGTAFVLLGHG